MIFFYLYSRYRAARDPVGAYSNESSRDDPDSANARKRRVHASATTTLDVFFSVCTCMYSFSIRARARARPRLINARTSREIPFHVYTLAHHIHEFPNRLRRCRRDSFKTHAENNWAMARATCERTDIS